MLVKALFISMLLITGIGYSQQEKSNRIESVAQQDLIGTFQIVLTDERMIEPELTDTILQLVESHRLQSQEMYVELDSYTKLYLPSLDQINDENFVNLELYRYE